MFEQAAVFERGIGEVTDVVEKELFRITPRTEEAESWALRPEPTAGIVRAYIQNGMQTWPQPVRLTTIGPMFRYDRPQAGRYRQVWQFDVEAIGDPGPAIDAEIIELGTRFYAEVGVGGVEVLINSIGDPGCRPAYLDALGAYYREHADALPPAELGRLERNALRLLDSKDPAMAAQCGRALIADCLCDACAAHFTDLQPIWRRCAVPVDPDSSAGSTTRDRLRVRRRGPPAAGTGGGGRYDGLVALRGRPTPGSGLAWARSCSGPR